MSRELIFLGTGTSQGIPVIACDCDVCRSTDPRDKRFRTSAYLNIDNKGILIDAGPDFRSQMLNQNIRQLDSVLITHIHKDHTAGMDDIRTFNFLHGRGMPVHARPEVLDNLRLSFGYAFPAPDKYPGAPDFLPHPFENSIFEVAGIEVQPVFGYHARMIVTGFRIGDFLYFTDVNRVEDSEKEKMKNLDTLVISALQRKPHHSHFSLSEALQLIEELQPKRAFLTHLSHLMGLHTELEKELPDHVQVAYDGLKITF